MVVGIFTQIGHSRKYELCVLFAIGVVAMSLVSVEAHNGAVVVAAPTSGVVVDGDLSDWSQSAPGAPAEASNPWHTASPTSGFRSIAHTPQRVQLVEYGAPPVDAADFSATLQTAYDPERQILYVAIQTSDQSVWVDTTAKSTWNSQDGCDIYLALHDTNATMVRQYAIYGDELALGSGTNVEYAVVLTDSSSSYEWGIDLVKIFGPELQSRSNVTLGFDISVSDYDADGSYSWFSWGPGIRKFQRSDRLGDLLLSRSALVGLAKGRMEWLGDGQPAAGRRLRLHAQSTPSFWVDALSDDTGQWQIQLPVGRYSTDELGIVSSTDTNIDVGDGFAAEHTFVVRETKGHPLGVGEGEIIHAGSGDLPQGWVSFGPEDGLPFSGVDAMAEDHQGRLWLGRNAGGLCYFDGQNFVHFTTQHGLPSDQVYSLAADSVGRIWVGTLHGLLYFDGSDFVVFTTEDGLIDDHVSALMVARDSTIWIGTTQGVSRYDGRRFTDLKAEDGLTSGEVLTLMEDRRGRVWIGSLLGLAYYDGSGVQHVGGDLDRTSTIALVETDEGQILASTSKGLYAEKNGRFEKTKFTEMMPKSGTSSMTIDSLGSVWVASGSEIYKISTNGAIDVVEGAYELGIRQLLAGKQGYLWAGTVQGLWRWDSETVVPYQEGWLANQDGSKSRHFSQPGVSLGDVLIPRSDGGVWIGADNNLASIDRELRFNEELLLDSTQTINTLLEDRNGTLWIGMSANTPGEKLFSFRDGHLDSLDLGKIEFGINAMHEDSEGSLWIGTQNGLWRMRGDILDHFTVSEGLSSNYIRSIASDPKGKVWIVTVGGVCLYVDGEIRQWKLNTRERIEKMGSRGSFEAVFVDRDERTWFGINGGILVFEPGDFSGTNFSDSAVRIDVNTPNMFTQDDRGILLIGGNRGITLYDGNLYQTIGHRDGLDPPVFDLVPIGNQLVVLTGKGFLSSRAMEKSRASKSKKFSANGPTTMTTLPWKYEHLNSMVSSAFDCRLLTSSIVDPASKHARMHWPSSID